MPVQRRPRVAVSTRAVLAAAAATVATTFVLVFWLTSASVMVEWQIALAIVSGCLAVGLSAALYRGVRLPRPGQPPERKSLDLGEFDLGSLGYADFSGCSDDAAAVVAFVVVAVAVVIAAIVTVEALLLIAPPVLFAIYAAVNRALRTVFARSRRCAGNLRRSLAYGLGYTGLGMGVVFAATWLAWLLVGRR